MNAALTIDQKPGLWGTLYAFSNWLYKNDIQLICSGLAALINFFIYYFFRTKICWLWICRPWIDSTEIVKQSMQPANLQKLSNVEKFHPYFANPAANLALRYIAMKIPKRFWGKEQGALIRILITTLVFNRLDILRWISKLICVITCMAFCLAFLATATVLLQQNIVIVQVRLLWHKQCSHRQY